MATTYEWSFPNFETDADNKVKNIHWRYTAVDGDNTADIYGSCGGDDMDYDSMTKANATACVLTSLDKTEAELKTQLDADITAQKTPALTSKTKSW